MHRTRTRRKRSRPQRLEDEVVLNARVAWWLTQLLWRAWTPRWATGAKRHRG